MSEYLFDDLALCPQCNNYPLLYLDNDKPKDILIKCENCGYNQYLLLHNYLSQMKTTSTVINDNKYCSIHNRLFNKYCITCKLYLCNRGVNHESHKIISLDDIISTTKITNQVKEGYNHINIYCNKLKNNNKNKQLQYSYQSFNMINNDIFKYNNAYDY